MAADPVMMQACEALATNIFAQISEHLRTPPNGPHRIYETLNALAACTAQILVGCEDDADKLRGWFDKCLTAQLAAGADGMSKDESVH